MSFPLVEEVLSQAILNLFTPGIASYIYLYQSSL